MNWNLRILTVAFAVGLAGCGDSHNAARAVINGQEFEMGVQSVDCWAGPPMGPAISGYDGVMDSPLVCKILFRSRSMVTDSLTITVNNVVPIYRDFTGQWIPIGGGLVWVEYYLQGLPQAIFEAQIKFDKISNYSGDSVCAAYDIQTGSGLLEGNFCGRVRDGF